METPDVTRFCLETADIVKAKVDELTVDDKFVLLTMLDNFLHKIRLDVTDEWRTIMKHKDAFKNVPARQVTCSDGVTNLRA